MKVTLNQRWGSHAEGDVVDVTDTEGEWLVGLNRGTAKGLSEPQQGPAAPGSNGADRLAGGDPTRRYGLTTNKVERAANAALPVPGSPVQYNAGVSEQGGQEQTGRPAAKQRAREAAAGGRPAAGGAPADDSAPAGARKGTTRGRKDSAS